MPPNFSEMSLLECMGQGISEGYRGLLLFLEIPSKRPITSDTCSYLTIVLLNPDLSFFGKHSVDPDQFASDKAIRSGSTLFPTQTGKLMDRIKILGGV